MGVNPWLFKNWWEDNWLSDVYLPFSAVFLVKVLPPPPLSSPPLSAARHRLSRFFVQTVTVQNYGHRGSGSSGGGVSPSYAVSEGRVLPPFYRAEVEAAREHIRRWLGRGGAETEAGIGADLNTSFCHDLTARPHSLVHMPVRSHGECMPGQILSTSV